MQKICSKCNFIGKENRSIYIYIVAPIFLIFLAISFFLNLEIFATPQIGVLAPLIWLVFGIYTLIMFIDKPSECPNCKSKRTMIPLDTPKAQALIKEHNLSIPEDALQPSSPKTSQ